MAGICEGCQKDCDNGSLLKHISHTRSCKIVYGERYVEMLRESRKATKRENWTKNKDERNAKRKKSPERLLEPSNKSEDTEASMPKKPFVWNYQMLCKKCNKPYKKAYFKRHLTKSESCRESYEDYIENHKKTRKSNRNYHKRNYQNKHNAKWMREYYKENKEDLKKYTQEEIDGFHTKCKGCGIEFHNDRFLRHVSHDKKCKAHYDENEYNELKKERRKFINWSNHVDKKEERKEKMKKYYEENKKAFVSRRKKRLSIEKEESEIRSMKVFYENEKKYPKKEIDYIIDTYLSYGKRNSSLLQSLWRVIEIILPQCKSELQRQKLKELHTKIDERFNGFKKEYVSIEKEVEKETGDWDLNDPKKWRKECSVDRNFIFHIYYNFIYYMKAERQLLTYHSHNVLLSISKEIDIDLYSNYKKFDPVPISSLFVEKSLELGPKVCDKEKQNDLDYIKNKEIIRGLFKAKERQDDEFLKSLKKLYSITEVPFLL